MEFFYMFLFFPLALLYLLRPFFLRKFQKLPPTPLISLPVIGHLYLLKKPLHRTLAKISAKHGAILLLHFGSRPVLLVSSPSAAEECLTTNDITFANRPRLLAGKHLGHNYTSLVWASYGAHWRNLRRIASLEILSSHRIQTFADIRRNEVRLLVKRLLRGTSQDGHNIVDMKSAFFETMLNVMMRMISGKRYYDDDQSGNLEERRRFKEIVTETFQLSGAANAGDFLPVLRWIGVDKLEKRLKVLKEKRESFMQDIIDEHRKMMRGCEGQRIQTLMMFFCRSNTDPECYTDEIIRGMMQVMLSAGTDTSVATMEWAMSLLLNNLDALIQAQNEIDNRTGHSRLVDDSDLPHLPYLHGIINETLRMYPPTPCSLL
ncbi:cytochrome [Sesamum angolense]|uniref:Cytochrome n=1 Tax=Sesamum angolense TaxID=2727404 RepID=A0AAE2BM50_9LAMI|nr:cytochrome [Sesamum angolense]